MINDTHGAFLDSTDGNNIGRVDTLLDSLRTKNGEYITIVNGDAFQGTYVSSTLYGRPLVDAFNAMNLSAFVLGNHDFDWGLDKIALYKDGDVSNGEANFPFLGANIYIKGTNRLPSFVEPYTVIEYGDIKVGVIGVIGGDQESDILTKHVENYEFVNDPTNIIATHAAYLRTVLDCDSVVVASHDYNQSLNSKLAQLEGAQALDAIFCAHTHQLVNSSIQRADGKNISVVQNGDKNDTAMGVELIYTNGEYSSFKNTIYQPENYAISQNIQSIINNYQDLIEESERVLGSTNSKINKSTLGNYATKSLLEYDYASNGYSFDTIDVAIINTGGIRSTIPAGSITAAEVFEVFPFENMVVLVNINGSGLKSVYKANSSYLYVATSSAIGNIDNLSNNTIYQLAIIDYVFTSTHSSYNVFDQLDPSQYIYTDIVLRNAMIEYIDAIY
jgi:2',3'-cyclic-nucleotide 2'-phosphodiesterase (5'-nucleotidase family)